MTTATHSACSTEHTEDLQETIVSDDDMHDKIWKTLICFFFSHVTCLTQELTMYQNTIKYVVKHAHVYFHVICFVQGRCTVAGLRRVDLHNGQETAAPFANNGTVMAEE